MSWGEHVRGLIRYNEWANEKLLAAVREASPAELETEIGPGAGTISSWLNHLVNVQRGWFAIILGNQDHPLAGPGEAGPLVDVDKAFAMSAAEMRAYGDAATDAKVGETISRYDEQCGETESWPAWQLITQLLNHSTHHRSEIGRALGNLGHSPGDLDFIEYLDEAGGK